MTQPPINGSTAPAIAVINPETGAKVAFGYPSSGFTLILFLRGTWCPYCTEQLKALAKHKDSLEKIGFRIVCVSPESQKVLQAYLPQRMGAEEVATEVRAIVAELNASGPGDMGKVMGVVKTRLAGKAEMGLVSAAVKAALA